MDVLLGRAEISVEEMLSLDVGDVLMLNQSQERPLKMRVEQSPKYLVEPVERSGVISVKVLEPIERPRHPACVLLCELPLPEKRAPSRDHVHALGHLGSKATERGDCSRTSLAPAQRAKGRNLRTISSACSPT